MATLVNRFGFILFSQFGPQASDLLGIPDGGAFTPGSASVILVPGETYSFYLAMPAGLAFDNGDIDLVTAEGLSLVLPAIGTLADLAVGPGVLHFIPQISIPAGTLLPEVYYRLRLNVAGGNTLFSNRLWLRRSGYEQTSALFSYRNRSAIGPIAYDLPAMSDFRNVLRLKCEAGLPQTESESEEYEQITTGMKVPVSLRSHLALPFVCPRTDAIGHEGWRTLLLHKDIQINGRAVSVKTQYSDGESGLGISDGSFQVWDSSYAIVNRC
ncbi:hypothetical protein [Spirosoma spitsbergense]|uniref:hypothetical protein n=1 Tax=Spirosoma spitsbergense TaxID=431554 RepID=UPI000379917E|nr:hypothetical protein [Spirosoma spitsbergense]